MDEDLLADLEDLGESADEDIKLEETEVEQPEFTLLGQGDQSIQGLTPTYHSKQMQQTLSKIEEYMKEGNRFYTSGRVEQDQEYPVIVQSNLITVEISHEIDQIIKLIKDKYAVRFPELESLILNPIDFAKIVKIIGNETDLTKLDLKALLPSATVMAITITATTTNGNILSQTELETIFDACDLVVDMDQKKTRLLNYVQSRMNMLAPNLTALLGPEIAAKLMGIAGGLTALAAIPACNILILGAQKKAMIGFSSIAMNKHQGVIYEADLVARVPNTPTNVRRKAARLLSAKCALACRVDLAREYSNGSMGKEFRDDVQKKIDLLLQPPPAKKVKALPLPIEFKKRRGGRRARMAKERNAGSELSKAANRVAFGEAEIEIGHSNGDVLGLGLLGGSTGKIRSVKTNTKYKLQLSKRQKQMQNFSTNTNGLATSVAFTPVQGIELVDPGMAARRVKEANDKYFGNTTKKS
ncbi:U4/U6 small nuclear ribonucleoprotein Prp31 [Globomyces sp. JEL0801]|nr:U4/U6 small nuclear ribonucleoprotein Prp31 [Globomyces sp. JEL0801]